MADTAPHSDPGSFHAAELACRRGGRLVFEGLAFTLGPGQALVLTGPNGSGKSSLLRVLAGLLPPAAGQFGWGPEQVTGPNGDMARHVARLRYQGHLEGIKPPLTVREDLDFWHAMHGANAAPALSDISRSPPETLEHALDCFGIADLADLPCRYLSAGQRRRLALARLIVAPAPLWLLDEPSVALDKAAVAALEKVIAAHRARGGQVILSTHIPLNLPESEALDMAGFTPARPAFADAFED